MEIAKNTGFFWPLVSYLCWRQHHSEEEVHHPSSWASHRAVSGAKREDCVSGPFLCGVSRAHQHEHRSHDTSQKSSNECNHFSGNYIACLQIRSFQDSRHAPKTCAGKYTINTNWQRLLGKDKARQRSETSAAWKLNFFPLCYTSVALKG